MTDDTDDTRVEQVPPHETTAAPATVSVAQPHYFGVTPPMLLFGTATATLAIAVALAILAHWVAALVLAALSLLLLALFVGVARRRPDTPLARASATAADRLRERTAWMLETISVRSTSARELGRLRAQLRALAAQRETRLHELGAAVYAGDEQATQVLTDELRRLDEAAQGKEAEMQAVAEAADERIRRARLRVQPTLIEPPAPAPIPEPTPPPDEGTPPTPPLIPEPSPPPDEGTLPGPAPVPEPGPPSEI
jgi:signal transduction histidine kinase